MLPGNVIRRWDSTRTRHAALSAPVVPRLPLLQEYFGFPEKFLFIDVGGLERLASSGFQDAIEMIFRYRRSNAPTAGSNWKAALTPSR